MKIVYHKANAAEVVAFEDPKVAGRYVLPANSTEIEPPEFDASTHTCAFDGSQWVVTEMPGEAPAPEPIPAIDQLRMVRNSLLVQTDWRMLPDYPGTDQTEWQTYRQALRDITTQTPSLDSDGNLTGITWPTPPTD
jgi:hypothetical protein